MLMDIGPGCQLCSCSPTRAGVVIWQGWSVLRGRADPEGGPLVGGYSPDCPLEFAVAVGGCHVDCS